LEHVRCTEFGFKLIVIANMTRGKAFLVYTKSFFSAKFDVPHLKPPFRLHEEMEKAEFKSPALKISPTIFCLNAVSGHPAAHCTAIRTRVTNALLGPPFSVVAAIVARWELRFSNDS